MTNRIFTYIYRKKKDGPVLAYLVIHALSMIIVVVAIVLLAIGAAQVASGQYVQFEQNSTSDAVTILIVSAVIYAIALGIEIYLWIVVYSFYHQLKEEGQVQNKA